MPEEPITSEELMHCISKCHMYEDNMNKARNKIGLYVITKKVCNLYLGETGRKKVTFFWFCNSGDVPDNNKIDRNSFFPRQIQKLEDDSKSDKNLPDLIPVEEKRQSVHISINPWQ
eukprot:15334496-Ditylum_brightwellii.AAC.2